MSEENEKPKKVDKETIIEKANAAAERLERANEKLSELLLKQEQANVENTLGGESSAGIKKELSEDEKAIESAKALLEGTGHENLFDEP